MSGDLLVALGGAAAAVAALIALCWLIGFRGGARVADVAHAQDLIAAEEPAARVLEAVIDRHGRAALTMISDGRLGIVRAMGDRFVTRVARADAFRIQARSWGVRISAADLGFPGVSVRLEALPDWLARRTAKAGVQTP